MEDIFFEVLEDVADSGDTNESTWHIIDDTQAEWAANKIREEQDEYDRRIRAAQGMIERYKVIIEDLTEQKRKRTSGLKFKLMEYFNSVQHKCTKTQESYALASAKLVLRKPAPKPKVDDAQLLAWVKENAPDYVQTIERPMWGELKKTLTLDANGYLNTVTGEYVEGVELVPQDQIFDITF